MFLSYFSHTCFAVLFFRDIVAAEFCLPETGWQYNLIWGPYFSWYLDVLEMCINLLFFYLYFFPFIDTVCINRTVPVFWGTMSRTWVYLRGTLLRQWFWTTLHTRTPTMYICCDVIHLIIKWFGFFGCRVVLINFLLYFCSWWMCFPSKAGLEMTMTKNFRSSSRVLRDCQEQ